MDLERIRREEEVDANSFREVARVGNLVLREPLRQGVRGRYSLVCVENTKENPIEVILWKKLGELLKAFMQKPAQVLTRGYLMSEVWETNYLGDTRTLDVHISHLRRALGSLPEPRPQIKTLRDTGYILVVGSPVGDSQEDNNLAGCTFDSNPRKGVIYSSTQD